MVFRVVTDAPFPARLTTTTFTFRCLSRRRSFAPLRFSLNFSSRDLPAATVKRARPMTTFFARFARAAETWTVALSLDVQGLPPTGQNSLMPGSTTTVDPTAFVETRPEVLSLGFAAGVEPPPPPPDGGALAPETTVSAMPAPQAEEAGR